MSEAKSIDNIEAEQAVLGTILLHNTAFDVVSKILEPDHFSEPLHAQMYRAVSDMLAKGKGANPVTIMDYLPADEQITEDTNVRQYVARLVGQMAQPVNWARDTAVSIYEMWLRRKALTECAEFVDRTRELPADHDILDEIGALEEKLSEIRAKRLAGEKKGGSGARYLERMTQAYQRREVAGAPIFMKEIQDVISEPCFEAGNLYGLLSSSGEGKTSLTLQIVFHALDKGHPVQFLSFDQTEEQCIRQMVAQVEGIEARRQRRGDLSDKEWLAAQRMAQWLDRQPIEFVDLTNENAARIMAYARPFVRRYGNGKVPLVVVDHIGMVTPENPRADEGSKAKQIAGVFKAAAKETGTAWLVLNQRNSYGMSRDNPRPIAKDLYGGEAARYAYDAVFYLFRWMKHYEERKAIAATAQDWKKINSVFPSAVRDDGEDLAEIGVIKSRFGNPSIKRTVEFEARLTRYRSLKEESEPELLP